MTYLKINISSCIAMIGAILWVLLQSTPAQAATIITPKNTGVQQEKTIFSIDEKAHRKRNKRRWIKAKSKLKIHAPNTLQTGGNDEKKKFPWFAVICWSILGILLGLIIVGAILGIPAMWISATVILSSLIIGLFLLLILIFKIFRH